MIKIRIHIVQFIALLIAGPATCAHAENATDSLLPVKLYGISAETGVPDIIDIEIDYKKSGNNKQALTRLLKVMKVKKALKNKRTQSRLFLDLATVSARLRLYPQAMQCFYRTVAADSVSDENSIYFSAPDSITIANVDSPPIDISSVIESFDDKKPAAEYALILQVKQPVPGKRRVIRGIGDVGHMFVTLIKYNMDNSYVCRSFGFYPDKNSNIAATPLYPRSRSTFKDDIQHDWDEMVGRFISEKRFYRILRLLNRYRGKTYNLNNNNCTDFGLTLAEIGGIRISGTRGKWLLGQGNNPADAGQRILHEKVLNTDLANASPLFICMGNSLPQW